MTNVEPQPSGAVTGTAGGRPDSASTRDRGDLVIRAASLLTGPSWERSDGPVSVVVRGDRIASVGGPTSVSPGAREVDVGSATLIPGLIDAHTHFLGVPSNEEYQFLHFEDPALRSLRAARQARELLHVGFTSARCLGSSVGPALARAIEAGEVEGPRLQAAGRFICPTNGTWDHVHLPVGWVREQGIVADGVDGVAAMVRQRVREGATVIKVGLSQGAPGDYYHAWGDDPNRQVAGYSDAEVAAALDEAHRSGLKVSAHCIGDDAVLQAIRLGVDTIEHGYGISVGTRQRLAAAGALVVSTLCQLQLHVEAADRFGYSPSLRGVFERHRQAMRDDFRRGLKAGVRYALGTDLVGPPTHPLREAAREFELAVELGMAPQSALDAGTRVAAEALGVDGELGTLEVGRKADLVAVDGDPIADIGALKRIRLVVKGGEVAVAPGESTAFDDRMERHGHSAA